jgi:ethanolamine utilization protein EutM
MVFAVREGGESVGNAIGLIETVGLGAAIAAADAGLKTAAVSIAGFERTNGAGMMVVKFRGDVAAVQAAVEAGVCAAEKLSASVMGHVIPRPAI